MNSYEETEAIRGQSADVFYTDLSANGDFLVEESGKKLLLDALGEAGELFRTEIYGFCVLDDRIRLLVGGRGVKRRTVRSMLMTMLERFEGEAGIVSEELMIPEKTRFCTSIVRITDERDIVSVLRYIHLTPYSEGYASSAIDYWWSSYVTYRSHYIWSIVNSSYVLHYLGRNDCRAVQTMAEYHRRGEVLKNPIPDVLRDRSSEPLDLRPNCDMKGNLNDSFMA